MYTCRQSSHTHKIKMKGNLKFRSACGIDSLIDGGRVFEALWILSPRHSDSEQLGRKITNPGEIFTTKQSNTEAPQTSQIQVRASFCTLKNPKQPWGPLERIAG